MKIIDHEVVWEPQDDLKLDKRIQSQKAEYKSACSVTLCDAVELAKTLWDERTYEEIEDSHFLPMWTKRVERLRITEPNKMRFEYAQGLNYPIVVAAGDVTMAILGKQSSDLLSCNSSEWNRTISEAVNSYEWFYCLNYMYFKDPAVQTILSLIL